MERRTSRIGPGINQALAFALDCIDEVLVSGFIRPRRARRRHLAAAQLAQHLLPKGAVAVEIGEIQGLQVHARAGLWTKMASVAVQLPGLPGRMLVKAAGLVARRRRSGILRR